MKKRFFKLVGLGLGICAATILIPLGIVTVFRFATTGRISLSLTELLLSDFARAVCPCAFFVVIGVCLLGVSMPYDKKENRTQAPKKYKIAIVLEMIGILFVSVGLAWLLRFIDNEHRSLALWVATIGAGLIAVITTCALLAVASAKKQKNDWRNIFTAWIPVLCILLIASPWTDAPPSVNISLPSISLFGKENKKATSGVITESIKVSQDLETNIYHVKCTVKNTGKTDTNTVIITLYYYVYVGGRQIAHTEPVRCIRAGESYTFTASISDPYIDPTRDPYLRISVLN